MAAPHPYDEPPPWADEPPPDLDDGPPVPRPRSADRGRTIPHDDPAERAILGAALMSATAVADAFAHVTPADFYTPRHATIAGAIVALADRGEPVDPLTVADQLGAAGLAQAGGMAVLIDLHAEAPGHANAGHYARIVARLARHRRAILAATQLADDLWAATDPDAALVDHRARIDELGHTLAAGSHLRIADIGDVLDGDVVAPEATLLERTDGRCLFYPGAVNTLQAEPSAGKSWVACTTIAQVLALGGAAVYLDWEDSPTGIVGRLLTLGCPPDAIRARFRYARAEGSWGAAEHTAAHQLIDTINPDLVVIDGVADAMAHDGLDENDAGEFTDWANRVPRPLAWSTGAAVVMLDHVRKATDKGDRYARGTGAKLAIIDGAAYVVKVLEPYSRHRAGRMALIVAKDRHGSVGAIGETVAHLPVMPMAGGERTTIEVQPPPVGAGPGGMFMPTTIMTRVSAMLAEGPKTAATVHALLGRSKREHVEAAIVHLTRLKHVETRLGPGGQPMLHLIAPYHHAPGSDPTEPAPTDEEAQQQLAFVPDLPPDHDPEPGF